MGGAEKNPIQTDGATSSRLVLAVQCGAVRWEIQMLPVPLSLSLQVRASFPSPIEPLLDACSQ